MYTRFMLDTYGQEKIDELLDLAGTTLKLSVNDLLALECEYKALYDNFKSR